MRHIRLCLRVQGPAHLRAAVAAALLTGCVAGKPSGTFGADTGVPSGADTGGADTGGAASVSYPTVRDEVLVLSCGFGTCHGSGVGGLTLTEETTAADLIWVNAIGMPGSVYVVPGDPDNSYIILKMEGTAGIAGSVMPTTGALDPDRIAIVRSWIAGGAG